MKHPLLGIGPIGSEAIELRIHLGVRRMRYRLIHGAKQRLRLGGVDGRGPQLAAAIAHTHQQPIQRDVVEFA